MRLSILVLLLSLFVLPGCKEVSEKTTLETDIDTTSKDDMINYSLIEGGFAHTVYFWLHRPDNKADRTAFETSLTKFILNSPDITTRHIGIPAATAREVIDTSYTYSLLLTFKDKAAQDRYQEDPAHKLFIEESSTLWSKVVVYDSENFVE